MSLSETMKNHMDAVRGVTDASGLLSMAMATEELNGAQGGLLPVHDIEFGDDTDDIDNYTEQGQYLIKNHSSDPINHHDPCTSNDWGSLFVFKNNWYINQVMIDNNVNPAAIYHRSRNWRDGKPWTSWFKLGRVTDSYLVAFPLYEEVAA